MLMMNASLVDKVLAWAPVHHADGTDWLECRLIWMADAPTSTTGGSAWRAVVAMMDGTFRVVDLTTLRHDRESGGASEGDVRTWRKEMARLIEAMGPLRESGETPCDAAVRLISDMDIATRLAQELLVLKAEQQQLITEASQLIADSNAEIERLKAQLADALPKGRRGDRLPEHES
jgi:uncharacterized coiled-coil protein SlyX